MIEHSVPNYKDWLREGMDYPPLSPLERDILRALVWGVQRNKMAKIFNRTRDELDQIMLGVSRHYIPRELEEDIDGSVIATFAALDSGQLSLNEISDFPDEVTVLGRFGKLKEREKQIFKWMAQGFKPKFIWENFEIDKKVVYILKSQVLKKLGINNQFQIAALVWQLGPEKLSMT